MPRITVRSILMLSGMAFLQAAPLAGHAAETCDYGTDPKNGLVVFSGTMPKSNDTPMHIGAPMNFSYSYNHAGATFLTRQSVLLSPLSLLFQSVPSDFPDGFGRVFILRLSAGDYEFVDWSYKGFGKMGMSKALGVKPLKFTVEAQHAVYLGNFDPYMFEGRNLFGQTVVEPWLTIRDQSTRDLTAFQAKCPGFDVTQIDVKVMDPAPWIVHKKKS